MGPKSLYLPTPLVLTPPTEGLPWDDLRKIFQFYVGKGTEWRRKITENFNRLSRVHERYRQTTDRRQTDLPHILHRFRDISLAVDRSEIAIFCYPSWV